MDEGTWLFRFVLLNKYSTITCRMYTFCHKSHTLNVNSRQLDLMCSQQEISRMFIINPYFFPLKMNSFLGDTLFFNFWTYLEKTDTSSLSENLLSRKFSVFCERGLLGKIVKIFWSHMTIFSFPYLSLDLRLAHFLFSIPRP